MNTGKYERISIPIWLALSSEQADSLVNVPFPSNGNTLFVQQFPRDQAVPALCAVYTAANRDWRLIKNSTCVDAAFYHAVSIEHLGNDQLALYSASEGAGAVEIIKLSEEQHHLTQTTIATVITRSTAPEQIKLNDTKSAYYLSSGQVVQEHIPHCQETATSTASWSLYPWEFASKKLIPLQIELPSGSTLSPTSLSYAWRIGKQICIRPLNDTPPVCTALP